VAERRESRGRRLAVAVRDNRARAWHDRLPELLGFELDATAFRRSAEVEDFEAVVRERRHDFAGVSRRRWTVDLKAEALAALRRFCAIREPVVLLGIEPAEFFAVALPDAAFLRQPESLVSDVPFLALVAQSGSGGVIFEWAWTDPTEGDWGELASWGGFEAAVSSLPR
jgi:hypothetical protein